MNRSSVNTNSSRNKGRAVLVMIWFCDAKRILSVFCMMQVPIFQSLIKINLCFIAKITEIERYSMILY